MELLKFFTRILMYDPFKPYSQHEQITVMHNIIRYLKSVIDVFHRKKLKTF